MTEQQVRIFTSTDGQAQLEVALNQETVWLNQSQMSVLFGTSTDNVGLHLKNIYQEGELEEVRTTEDFSVVRQEGKRQVHRSRRSSIGGFLPYLAKSCPMSLNALNSSALPHGSSRNMVACSPGWPLKRT